MFKKLMVYSVLFALFSNTLVFATLENGSPSSSSGSDSLVHLEDSPTSSGSASPEAEPIGEQSPAKLLLAAQPEEQPSWITRAVRRIKNCCSFGRKAAAEEPKVIEMRDMGSGSNALDDLAALETQYQAMKGEEGQAEQPGCLRRCWDGIRNACCRGGRGKVEKHRDNEPVMIELREKLLVNDEMADCEANERSDASDADPLYRHAGRKLFGKKSRTETGIKLGAATIVGGLASVGEGRVYQVEVVQFIAAVLVGERKYKEFLAFEIEGATPLLAIGAVLSLPGNVVQDYKALDALCETVRDYKDEDAAQAVNGNKPWLRRGTRVLGLLASSGVALSKIQRLYESCGGKEMAESAFWVKVIYYATIGPYSLSSVATVHNDVRKLVNRFVIIRTEADTPVNILLAKKELLGKLLSVRSKLLQMNTADEFRELLINHPTVLIALVGDTSTFIGNAKKMRNLMDELFSLSDETWDFSKKEPMLRRICGYGACGLTVLTNAIAAYLVPQYVLANFFENAILGYVLAAPIGGAVATVHSYAAERVLKEAYDSFGYDEMAKCNKVEWGQERHGSLRKCMKAGLKSLQAIGLAALSAWQALPAFGQSVTVLNGGPDSMVNVHTYSWVGGGFFALGDAAMNANDTNEIIEALIETFQRATHHHEGISQMSTKQLSKLRDELITITSILHPLLEEASDKIVLSLAKN